MKNDPADLFDPFGLSPGGATLTLPRIFANPGVVVSPWVRAISGGIGLVLYELAFPQATARDEDLLKKDPTPCEKEKDRCRQVKENCIEQCSETTLPSKPKTVYGWNFQNCLNRCMESAGCRQP